MDPTLQMPDVGFRCASDGVDRIPTTMIDDFTRPALEGWAPMGAGGPSDWRLANGFVTVRPQPGQIFTMWRPTVQLGNTVLSARVHHALEGAGSVAILYGIQDAENHYRAEFFPAARVARIIRVLDGAEGVIAENSELSGDWSQWSTLNVVWDAGRHTFDLGLSLIHI